jgi:hypothetical protein
MKNRTNYIATPIATLTQNGLLAELLRRQSRKVTNLTRRREYREQRRGLFRNSFTWLLGRAQGVTATRRFRRGFEEETVPRHI